MAQEERRRDARHRMGASLAGASSRIEYAEEYAQDGRRDRAFLEALTALAQGVIVLAETGLMVEEHLNALREGK